MFLFQPPTSLQICDGADALSSYCRLKPSTRSCEPLQAGSLRRTNTPSADRLSCRMTLPLRAVRIEQLRARTRSVCEWEQVKPTTPSPPAVESELLPSEPAGIWSRVNCPNTHGFS